MGVTGCAPVNEEDRPTLSSEQENCDHVWEEIDWSIPNLEMIETIYCPKCKLEKEVSLKEWKKIQADMEYENSIENK